MRPRAPAASLLIARSRHRRPPPATCVGDRDRIAPRLRGGGVSLRKVRSRRRNAGRRWSLPLALQVGAAAAGAGREHPRKPPFFPQKSSLFSPQILRLSPKRPPSPLRASPQPAERPEGGPHGLPQGKGAARRPRGLPSGSPQAPGRGPGPQVVSQGLFLHRETPP